MKALLALLLLALTAGQAMATPVTAEPATAEQLQLRAEYPVAGMLGGNLSGMAHCDGVWWAVSDREDDRVYRLVPDDGLWRAHAEAFTVGPPPATGLPAFLTTAARLRGVIAQGVLDLEGISCDAAGNRYVVSESYAAVLKLAADGSAAWLDLPTELVEQARQQGLLQRPNALLEGIAVDADARRLWLAAERQGRGLLRVDLDNRGDFVAAAVLLAEDKRILPPPALGDKPLPADFSALAYFGDKLFTLERLAHRICRRHPDSAAVERCWSYADSALAPARRYDSPYGLAEALWLDQHSAWIGVDNNEQRRADGEIRPVVWHFAAPPGGWLASAEH